ncbi:MAG: hypothetical protein M3O34_05690 [Chloroflexota bacterium]|nr:hypothetical protein [Chloroflexota bacterium]
MYAVVRRYTGGGQLADALTQRRQEVVDLLRGVPGFRAYYALRANDGTVATITVCDDQAGTQESTRLAAEWVRQNMSGASISPPEVTEGETFLNF